MVYQRFTNNAGSLLDLRLVRPDGTGDHPLLTERPGNQTHPDWSPDGNRIVYTVDDTQLWIANADGTAPTRLPIDCSTPCVLIDEAAWSPDGQEIVFIREEEPPGKLAFDVVQAIHLADDTVRTVYSPPPLQGTNHPRWAPDGTSIVLELSRFDSAEASGPSGSAVAIVDTAKPSATAVLLTDWLLFAAYPDWSWANDTIVFSTYDLGRRDARGFTDPSPPSDLYTVKPDGTGLTQLTHNPSGTTLIRNRTASGPLSTQPTWSSDGTTIIFVQVDGDTWPGWSMAAMAADGSNLRTAVGDDLMVGTHPRVRPAP
jgi:Tol biopolymer transport system component